jgi:hypothetical protein
MVRIVSEKAMLVLLIRKRTGPWINQHFVSAQAAQNFTASLPDPFMNFLRRLLNSEIQRWPRHFFSGVTRAGGIC